MSRLESAPILQYQFGFVPDVDFVCSQTVPGSVTITWLSALPQPSEATLNAVVWNPTIEAQWQASEQAKQIGGIVPALLAAPISTTLATLVNTGFGWNLPPNRKFGFEISGQYTTAVATTGIGLAIDGPSSLVRIAMNGWIAESTTAARQGSTNADLGVLLGTGSAAGTRLPFDITGFLFTGSGLGRLDLMYRSEVAASQVSIVECWGKLFCVAT